jgi:hypothetical protein
MNESQTVFFCELRPFEHCRHTASVQRRSSEFCRKKDECKGKMGLGDTTTVHAMEAEGLTGDVAQGVGGRVRGQGGEEEERDLDELLKKFAVEEGLLSSLRRDNDVDSGVYSLQLDFLGFADRQPALAAGLVIDPIGVPPEGQMVTCLSTFPSLSSPSPFLPPPDLTISSAGFRDALRDFLSDESSHESATAQHGGGDYDFGAQGRVGGIIQRLTIMPDCLPGLQCSTSFSSSTGTCPSSCPCSCRSFSAPGVRPSSSSLQLQPSLAWKSPSDGSHVSSFL